MGHHLFHLDISLAEKVVRTLLVYVALAVLLRLAGKRDLAQLNSFDLVVMLLLSNVVQNAVIGPDDSLVGGLVGAAVLVAVNALVVRASAVSAPLANLFEGHETVLATNGRYDDRALRREGLRRADLDAALKRQGAGDVSQVAQATLGTGGAVVVTLQPESAPATKADVAAIAAALNRLEQRLG
jgi:uncharacterized membrane protein YcaP (DUF421 family)